jgi:tRNA 2-selenouridine synthase
MDLINIHDYIRENRSGLLIDVRSPSEFTKGNIPGSINVPLLSDEERREIGTIYKRESKRKAIRRGLDFFGPKMRDIVSFVDSITGATDENSNAGFEITCYCWRGGMRSNIVAWLLETYGYKVTLIKGGYKSYRHWCLEQFEKSLNIILLGGHTGTGKTIVLKKLRDRKLPVIDLEGIANHKGSAFGGIGLGIQPSQETFENQLAHTLFIQLNLYGYVILEDESQRIGTVSIPQPVWEQMKKSSLLFLNREFHKRLNNIIDEYGNLDRSLLCAAVIRLQKRLGGLETKKCLEFLVNKDLRSSFSLLLVYYDKLYQKALEQKQAILKTYVFVDIDDLGKKDLQSIEQSIKGLV